MWGHVISMSCLNSLGLSLSPCFLGAHLQIQLGARQGSAELPLEVLTGILQVPSGQQGPGRPGRSIESEPPDLDPFGS